MTHAAASWPAAVAYACATEITGYVDDPIGYNNRLSILKAKAHLKVSVPE